MCSLIPAPHTRGYRSRNSFSRTNLASSMFIENVGQFGPWTIRTLVYSDLSCGQFGLWTIRTLVNSDLFTLVISDHSLWSIRTSYCCQFGPRPLNNSDPDIWSIQTLTFCCLNSISIFVHMIMGTCLSRHKLRNRTAVVKGISLNYDRNNYDTYQYHRHDVADSRKNHSLLSGCCVGCISCS